MSAPKTSADSPCGKAAETLIAGGVTYSCVLPKGHEGPHRGGGRCFRHGNYVGVHGCSQCFPSGAQQTVASVDSPEVAEAKQRLLVFAHWLDAVTADPILRATTKLQVADIRLVCGQKEK